jgi:hypothetical protein
LGTTITYKIVSVCCHIIQGTKASISVVTGTAIFAKYTQKMATTTAMVMLALALWAMRQLLGLFLFVDKSSKESRQVYPLSLALPFLQMTLKMSSQKWQQHACLGSLGGETTYKIVLFVDKLSKEPRQVHLFLLALPYC